ncbi:MAG TPA: GTP cyclohydrolase I FolE [Elusimicrobia bacterium]|nr:MAG: GTP cyclohydrolase I FolE [Elusimicrobia bacterium GWA2_66_18]OGR72647.1 MAG: GTP cyclohydrolase I FolE [Elusimicrobia bacterium GWC2_65_9]HAZ08204.1 GTP cyclohydrolase I FolE [Elusimicrobiota bacterium]
MESHFRDILKDLGEDPKREGLLRTPHRVAKAWRELTSGYRVDIDAMINEALFTECYDEMVLVRDLAFYSVCEHHLLPFFGRAHVAYLPDQKIVGLSKIPKLVEIFARRLQVQERLTLQIAYTLQEKLKPRGVAVVLEARHLCMEMRGAESHLSPTTTSCMLGVFKEEARTRAEFLELIKTKPV